MWYGSHKAVWTVMHVAIVEPSNVSLSSDLSPWQFRDMCVMRIMNVCACLHYAYFAEVEIDHR